VEWASYLVPKPPMPTAEWGEKYFRLPAEGADRPGPYDLDYAPYLYGIFAALDDPLVGEVVTMKAAQVGWTFGLIVYLGKIIDTMACAIVVMFPKTDAAREFNDEKFEPSVLSTPVLNAKLDVSKTRSKDNRSLFKKFTNGFLKFVTSGSISSVKSTPAKIVIVEEPDDAVGNLAEQGSAITLLWERTKRKSGAKRVLGGTPSVDGLSKVQEHIKTSDQRVLPIECHECLETHVLDWENVTWLNTDDGTEHEVFGTALPDTSTYVCPCCGSPWGDYQRKTNIRNTIRNAMANGDENCGWVATTEFHGVAGFMELSELYSCLPGAGVVDLVRDYLKAEHKASMGDETDRIVFVNSKLGRPYAFKDDHASAETLREKAIEYTELLCPRGGLLVTIGIDIQHDRIAIVIRAWGRGEESWLLYWGEISASVGTSDKNDPVYSELDSIVFGAIDHELGGKVYASAISIDSSDGNTNDAVYHWARTRQKQHPKVLVMAIKGSSSQQDPEIFTTPSAKPIDHKNPKKRTKADKHGLRVYMVGTNKAKDWLASHMKLEGLGAGRHHVYQNVRADYFDQITGEVKAPHRSIRNRKVWQQKAGRAIEAWDCEVYALHGARARRVHLLKPAQWDALEQKLQQVDLFAMPEQVVVIEADVVEKTKQRKRSSRSRSSRSNSFTN
jgi:phage terminase large subunit GpA-like protein